MQQLTGWYGAPCASGSDHRRALSPMRCAQDTMLEGMVWGIVKHPPSATSHRRLAAAGLTRCI